MKSGKQICCICGKPFSGYGNNAQPVKEGQCCDECNWNVVIPARIEKLREANKEKQIDDDKH